MKLSTKPISSPGRTEKFPPPLMRFLRSNVGSKSRGRSRSSPMFVRKKNAAIETQEPSSPKVTCMGQVRVRRSSKQASAKPSRTRRTWEAPAGCSCRWIPRALFCHPFAGKFRPKLCRPVWSKWASYFQLSFRRKVEIREEPLKIDSRFRQKSEDSEEEDDDEENAREAKVFVTSCSPPKNALILTRCRSAPYRSSSLASRFWGSPMKSEETREGEEKEEKEEEKEEEEKQSTELESNEDNAGNEKPKSEMDSLSDEDARIDPEINEKLQLFQEFDGSIGKRFSESPYTEDHKTGEEGFGRPLILTRCKSEPARTGEKLDPELSFWKNRRLGIVDSCSASVL